MFSSRLRHHLGRNRLAQALDRRRAAGLPIIDLTESNPTRAGLVYPAGLLAPLGVSRGLTYRPSPLGLLEARQAVSADYQRRGVAVPPERIVVTASTSEAYSLLFKLLCDVGDIVLSPRPSYPLVEHLTDLEGVGNVTYSLELHGRWSVDVEAVRLALKDARVRAIVVISPNNPTGSIVAPAELKQLAALAAEHDVAVIADEVFAEYAIENETFTSALSQRDGLTFALGGLSKAVGLPQVKLAWIGVSGPDSLVKDALDRLETICDAYLSVATPVQLAARELLQNGETVRAQIQARVRGNFAALKTAAVPHNACTVLPSEAGWYAVVQIPAVKAEETFVVDLLERTGILVHPGYFFDFEREAFLVVSLLPDPAIFWPAVRQLFAEVEQLS